MALERHLHEISIITTTLLSPLLRFFSRRSVNFSACPVGGRSCLFPLCTCVIAVSTPRLHLQQTHQLNARTSCANASRHEAGVALAWLQESSTCMSDTNPLPVPCDMAASHVRLLLAQTPTLPLRPLLEFSSFILAGAVEPSTTSEYRMPLSPAIPQHATPLSITPLHKGDGDGHITSHITRDAHSPATLRCYSSSRGGQTHHLRTARHVQQQVIVLGRDVEIGQALCAGKRHSIPEFVFQLGWQGINDALNTGRCFAHDIRALAGYVLRGHQLNGRSEQRRQ